MSAPSKVDLAHLAALASLSLTDTELQSMAIEIDAIVKYVDELAAVDTTDVPPTIEERGGVVAQAQLGATSWRTDEVREGLTHDEALREAPNVAHDGFAVPAFVGS